MMDIDNRPQDARTMGATFMTLFLLVRVVLCPILCAWVNGTNCDSQIIKFSSCFVTWIGYVWAWRAMNMAAKQLADVG